MTIFIHQLLVRQHTPAPRAALPTEARGHQKVTVMGGKQGREYRGASPVQEGMPSAGRCRAGQLREGGGR